MNSTDSRLRELDAARDLTDDLLDPRGDRARAVLARITSTDPSAGPQSAPTSATPATAAPTRARRRRLLPAVGIAAALVVGGTVGPAALGMNTASAQWVAMPTGVSASDADAAARPCRDLFLHGSFGDATTGDPAWPTSEQVRDMPVVVAEDRGSWRFVVMSDGRWSTTCLQQRSTLDRVLGVFGAHPGLAGGGGMTPLTELPTPSAREVRTVDVMGSSVSGTLRPASTVSAITGRVGADVVGVVVEPVGRPKVTATVAGGWFAGWWPEPNAADPATRPVLSGAETPVDTIPPQVALTVSLRDGTTVHYPVGSEQVSAMSGGGTRS